MSGSWKRYLRDEIFALEAYRPFEERPGLVRMDANESALPLDPEELDAFAAAARALPYHRYPEATGLPLREALAARWGVAPDELIVGNGSDEIIHILLTAFGKPQNGAPAKVLFPVPTFGMYDIVARACGVVPVKVPLGVDFRLDERATRDAMERERPSLSFFATPNNPTGNRFDPGAVERLARESDGCFVIDEAYADFAGATHLPLVRELPNVCVMRSLSKIGLAGLRLGALVGPRELVAELDKVRLPYNVSLPAMAFAVAALQHPERIARRVERLVASRRRLEAGLAKIPGVTVFPSEANFVLVRVQNDAREVFEQMLARGVVVRNMSRPGALDRCLRITAGSEEENARCLEALAAAVQ